MKNYIKPVIKKVSLLSIARRCSCVSSDDNPWLDPISPTGKK